MSSSFLSRRIKRTSDQACMAIAANNVKSRAERGNGILIVTDMVGAEPKLNLMHAWHNFFFL